MSHILPIRCDILWILLNFWWPKETRFLEIKIQRSPATEPQVSDRSTEMHATASGGSLKWVGQAILLSEFPEGGRWFEFLHCHSFFCPTLDKWPNNPNFNHQIYSLPIKRASTLPLLHNSVLPFWPLIASRSSTAGRTEYISRSASLRFVLSSRSHETLQSFFTVTGSLLERYFLWIVPLLPSRFISVRRHDTMVDIKLGKIPAQENEDHEISS